MATYQYLSLTPESLIVSMLPPEDFGRYMAVGTATRTSGQAMFFTLKDGFDGKEFGLEEAKKRCVPHADGDPKHSVYAAVYRVLERVPLSAIESLWLITAHGRALELKPGRRPPQRAGSTTSIGSSCPSTPSSPALSVRRNSCAS